MLFAKFQSRVGELFFTSYVNSIGSKIDRSDLIYASCTPSCQVHMICSHIYLLKYELAIVILHMTFLTCPIR
jgi:hypothetical protein